MLSTLCLSVLLGLGLLAGSALGQSEPASADDLFARHAEAVGGRAAAETHRNRVFYGTLYLADAKQHRLLTIWQDRSNTMRYELQAPGVGSGVRGWDGTHAWGFDEPAAPRLIDLESEEGKDIRLGSHFLGDLAFEEVYPTRELVGRSTFEGRPCWEVRAVSMVGTERRLHFDAETGLIAGWQSTFTMGQTPTPVVYVVSDYREVGGLLMAHKQIQRQLRASGPVENVVEYQHVRVNVEVLPEFAPPQALVAATGG